MTRIDQLQRAMARSMARACDVDPDAGSLFDALADVSGILREALGESEVELVVPVSVGSEILVDGARYRVADRVCARSGKPEDCGGCDDDEGMQQWCERMSFGPVLVRSEAGP